MLLSIRSLVSALLVTAIAACSIASNVSAQQYPYSKKTVYTDKKGTTLTVFSKKNGDYVGISKQRKGSEARFIPAGKGSSSVTYPVPKKPISNRRG